MKTQILTVVALTTMMGCVKKKTEATTAQASGLATIPFVVAPQKGDSSGLYAHSVYDANTDKGGAGLVLPDAPILGATLDQIVNAIQSSPVIERTFDDQAPLLLKHITIRRVSQMSYCDKVSGAVSASITAANKDSEGKDKALKTASDAAGVPLMDCLDNSAPVTPVSTTEDALGRLTASGVFTYRFTVSRYSIRFTFEDRKQGAPGEPVKPGVARDFETADVEVYEKMNVGWAANVTVSTVLGLPEGVRQIVASKWADIQSVELAGSTTASRQKDFSEFYPEVMTKYPGQRASRFQATLITDVVRPLCNWVTQIRGMDTKKVCAPITDPKVITPLATMEQRYLEQSDVQRLTGCKPLGTSNGFLQTLYILYAKVPQERNNFKKGSTVKLYTRIANGWERTSGSANWATADGEAPMANCATQPYVQLGDKCIAAIYPAPYSVIGGWGSFPQSFATICKNIDSGQGTAMGPIGMSMLDQSVVREEQKTLPPREKPVLVEPVATVVPATAPAAIPPPVAPPVVADPVP